jgi:hypothetical protein
LLAHHLGRVIDRVTDLSGGYSQMRDFKNNRRRYCPARHRASLHANGIRNQPP